MGLFFNYDKPGKGVNKDEPEKKGFFRYWEMVFEKFSKHLGTNCVHAILSIPFLVILFLIAPINEDSVKNFFESLLGTSVNETEVLGVAMNLRLMFSVLVYTLIGSGPATTVYAYISKCFTMRNPVWIISDGKDVFKQNFKQSIVVAIIDIALIFLGFIAISFYGQLYEQSGSMLWYVVRIAVILMMLVYMWSQMYIYQFITTFENKLKEHFKNAIILAIGSLPFTWFFSAITIAITVVAYSYLTTWFATLVLLIVAPIFTRLPVEFYAARKIDRLIINNQNGSGGGTTEPIENAEQSEEVFV